VSLDATYLIEKLSTQALALPFVGPCDVDDFAAGRLTIDDRQRHSSIGAKFPAYVHQGHDWLGWIAAILVESPAELCALSLGDRCCRLSLGDAVEQVVSQTKTLIRPQFLEFSH
jgi:hypothetical protein